MDVEASVARPLPPRIVFYDGVCGLCARSVQLLVRLDRGRAFHYAPLQGATAAEVRARLPEFPRDLETVVYLEDGKLSLRTQAYLAAARHLPFPWRAASWLRWLPSWLTDPAYASIAERRYRLFGRHDTCRIPTPEQRELFLP